MTDGTVCKVGSVTRAITRAFPPCGSQGPGTRSWPGPRPEGVRRGQPDRLGHQAAPAEAHHAVVERKGVDAFQALNRLAIAMSSNNDWIVPASASARRYFALDVSGDHIGDRPYFKKLLAAIDGDETAALFHHLLNLNLTGFEIRDVPQTEALGQQKLLSGESVQQWWFACLRCGSVELPMIKKGRTEAEALDAGVKWATGYSRELLRDLYYEWCRSRGVSRPANEVLFAKQLRRLCGGELEDVRLRDPESGKRSRLYVFKTLAEQRETFLSTLHIDPAGFDWEYAPDSRN